MLQETIEPDLQTGEPAADALDALRQRVQRLEETVAALQDTQQLEERVLGKLAKSTLSQAAGLVLHGGEPPLPSTAVTAHAPTPVMPTVVPPAPQESPWLLFDALSDFSTIWRMLFDWRYRFLTSTRIMVYGIVIAILTSHLWFPLSLLIWPIGGVLDKMLSLVLAFFVYKSLSREARRYRVFLQMNR